MKLNIRFAFAAVLLLGCASTDRTCAQCSTEIHGADWLVVQLKADGEIRNCWQLHDLSLANEPHSDGVWWVSSGEQVHISGWYNYVQVGSMAPANWNSAAATLGVNLSQCTGGRYQSLDEVKK